jgi:hypothetical protein
LPCIAGGEPQPTGTAPMAKLEARASNAARMPTFTHEPGAGSTSWVRVTP